MEGNAAFFGPLKVLGNAFATLLVLTALMVAGRYQTRPPLPFSPGLEAAGVKTDGTKIADVVSRHSSTRNPGAWLPNRLSGRPKRSPVLRTRSNDSKITGTSPHIGPPC